MNNVAAPFAAPNKLVGCCGFDYGFFYLSLSCYDYFFNYPCKLTDWPVTFPNNDPSFLPAVGVTVVVCPNIDTACLVYLARSFWSFLVSFGLVVIVVVADVVDGSYF